MGLPSDRAGCGQADPTARCSRASARAHRCTLVICQSGAASKRPHASSSNSSRHRASLAESATAARTRSAVGTKVETASRRPTASKARHVCSTATGVPSSRVITARCVTDAATPESRSRIRSAVEGLTSATASASSEAAARTSGANPVRRAKAWFAYSTPPLEEITTAASAASVRRERPGRWRRHVRGRQPASVTSSAWRIDRSSACRLNGLAMNRAPGISPPPSANIGLGYPDMSRPADPAGPPATGQTARSRSSRALRRRSAAGESFRRHRG